MSLDPKRDLTIERAIDAPPHLIWQAWTKPEHLKQWFTPRPWKTAECEVDLKPGGIFRVVMQSQEGELYPNLDACYLEIVENERLVWTMGLEPGYRPATQKSPDSPFFTCIVSIKPKGKGSLYSIVAMHRDEENCKQHDAMGFYEGWGTVVDQLAEYAPTIKAQ